MVGTWLRVSALYLWLQHHWYLRKDRPIDLGPPDDLRVIYPGFIKEGARLYEEESGSYAGSDANDFSRNLRTLLAHDELYDPEFTTLSYLT